MAPSKQQRRRTDRARADEGQGLGITTTPEPTTTVLAATSTKLARQLQALCDAAEGYSGAIDDEREADDDLRLSLRADLDNTLVAAHATLIDARSQGVRV